MCKCFTASILAHKIFSQGFVEKNVNMSNELNLPDVYGNVNYNWVTSKVYMNPFGVHSLCK